MSSAAQRIYGRLRANTAALDAGTIDRARDRARSRIEWDEALRAGVAPAVMALLVADLGRVQP